MLGKERIEVVVGAQDRACVCGSYVEAIDTSDVGRRGLEINVEPMGGPEELAQRIAPERLARDWVCGRALLAGERFEVVAALTAPLLSISLTVRRLTRSHSAAALLHREHSARLHRRLIACVAWPPAYKIWRGACTAARASRIHR